MAINIDQALGLHPLGLNLRAQRAAIISSNLTNQETPGFLPKESKFSHVLKAEKERLKPNYIKSKKYPKPNDFVPNVGYRKILKPLIGGNGVSPEVEQLDWARNNAEFAASTYFVKSRMNTLLHAITGK